MTIELRPRQHTDYLERKPKHIFKFKPMLKDTFYVDRMIWRRKVKERSGISLFFSFFVSFDTMSVHYNGNLKGSQVKLSEVCRGD